MINIIILVAKRRLDANPLRRASSTTVKQPNDER